MRFLSASLLAKVGGRVMQKLETQHNQTQPAPATTQGHGMGLESPRSGQITQLQSMIETRPMVSQLVQLTAAANNGERATAQRKTMDSIHGSPRTAQGVVMMKKDAALAEVKAKEPGWTATKIIKDKQGTKGVFRFPMNGDNIDTFVNKNSVPSGITIPSDHSDAKNPGTLRVEVSDHDLSQKYGQLEGLNGDDILYGGRPLHFSHGDQAHGKSRENSLTWHHKGEYGHMELIDMNVHGAFWHYGGIAHWKPSIHATSDDDDDGGTS
jgi:hypothetical protein